MCTYMIQLCCHLLKTTTAENIPDTRQVGGACLQSEPKAQQGHRSLDSTPVILSPLRAVCVRNP